MGLQKRDVPWLELRRTAALVDTEVDNALIQHCDLRRDTYLALSWLYRGGADKEPLSPRGLEKAVNLTPSGTSRLLARMEQEAVITRSPSAADRRAIEVSLTPSGVERLKRAQPFVADAIQRVLGDQTEFDMPVLVSVPDKSSPADGDDAAEESGDESLSISGILTWHTVDAVSAADAHVVRQAIEPVVLAEAARYATDAAGVDLARAVVDMVRSTGDPEAFFAADSRFHTTVASLCQNRILREIYLYLLNRLESSLRSVDGDASTTEPYLARRAKVHADLVDAITRHDLVAVEAAARSHNLVRVVDDGAEAISGRESL